MPSKVKPSELSKELMDFLMNYREDIQEEVEEAVDKITKEARDELKETSPRGKGTRSNPYYLGWSVKVQNKGKLKYTKVVWNKTNYQLTHLLEFGHATKTGGHTSAIPHIRPVEEKFNVEFVDLVENKIRRVK